MNFLFNKILLSCEDDSKCKWVWQIKLLRKLPYTIWALTTFSWRSICYCRSQECTIINSEAIHLINCWLGVFIYPLHDNWLYHNFADISPPKYIRWKANFKLLNDLFRCFLWCISFTALKQSTGKFIVAKHFSKIV